jgi:hypothetical protein
LLDRHRSVSNRVSNNRRLNNDPNQMGRSETLPDNRNLPDPGDRWDQIRNPHRRDR